MDPKSLLATIARLILASIAGGLVKDGYLQSSGTEAFIGGGMLAATGLWGIWNSYGKDIAKGELEILRAKVLFAAAKAKAQPATAAPALASVAAHVEATAPAAAPAGSASPPLASVILLGTCLSALVLAGMRPAGAAVLNPVITEHPKAFFDGLLMGFGLALAICLMWLIVSGKWDIRKPLLALLVGVFVLALLVTLAIPASAQTRQFAKPTGNPAIDIPNAIKGATGRAATDASGNALNAVENALAKPFQDLANFIGDDSAGAAALATAIPELQDGHGQQCWMAMKQFGEVAKAHPVPLSLKLLTDVEAFRLMGMAANNLCANPHCTQVFADMSNAVEAMSPINSVPIPSLNALCSKVPQVSVAPPVPVPPATTPATPAAQ